MLWLAIVGSLVLTMANRAQAIRPFVTDDARVVGARLFQLETWLLLDAHALEQYALPAIGPTDWLELTIGVTHGAVHSGRGRGYSFTGPILQGKALLFAAEDNGWPGLAVAAGTLFPVGFGALTPQSWNGFTYAAVTESLFDEGLLVHANVGIALAEAESAENERGVRAVVTMGLGVQARLFAGLHAVAEVYRGDPYDTENDYANTQVGFRYIFSDHVQMDGTFGSSLVRVSSNNGEKMLQQWGTLGLRMVSSELW